MLDDGGNGRVGHGLVGREAVGHNVLVRDAHLGAARADKGVRAVLGRLDNLHVQALVGKVAIGQRHVDARVVGVGRVVKHEGNLREVAGAGAARAGRVARRCGIGRAGLGRLAAAGKRKGGGGRNGATQEGAARDAAGKHGVGSHYRLFPSALFQGMQTRCSRSTSFMRPSDSAEMTMMTANMRSYEKDLRTRVM